MKQKKFPKVMVVRMPDDLRQEITNVANDLNLTTSDLVRIATENFVSQHRS